jgi:hypothetical protein
MELHVDKNFSAVYTSASQLNINITNPNNWNSLGNIKVHMIDEVSAICTLERNLPLVSG